MIEELHFKTSVRVCPLDASRLYVYKTTRRTVKSVGLGEFIAVEHAMYCKYHPKMLFRSQRLPSIVWHHCTYANDFMVEASMERFIDGRSCSEFATE